MDGSRFDGLTRHLARVLNRRALTGGLLAGALLPPAIADAARGNDGCVANGRRCGGKTGRPCKKCCSRLVTKTSNGTRRCTCRPNGDTCGNSSQCCDGTCTNGVCAPLVCDASNCASGCCQNGVCQPGTENNACGTGGIACVVCNTGDGFHCVEEQECQQT